MKLVSSDGTRFEMGVARYSYDPDKVFIWAVEDLNWLRVEVRAVDAEGRAWSAADSCLMTHELVQLAGWLGGLPALESDTASICFMEPCLSFEAAKDDGLYLFTVHLEYEIGRPAGSGPVAERVAAKLHFMLTPSELAEAAGSCRRMSESFPVRRMPDFQQGAV